MGRIAGRYGIRGLGSAVSAVLDGGPRPSPQRADAARSAPSRGASVRGSEHRVAIASMVGACREAICRSSVRSSEIDVLFLGSPDPQRLWDLGGPELVAGIEISRRVRVVPIGTEISDFATTLVLACEAIRDRRERSPLVVFGSCAQSPAAANGHVTAAAGAAVVGESASLRLEDYAFVSVSTEVDAPDEAVRGVGSSSIAERGRTTMLGSMEAEVPVVAAASLLRRNHVVSSEIALVADHMDPSVACGWVDRIQPKQHVVTALAGDNASGGAAVGLASLLDRLEVPHVVVLSSSSGCHVTAELFRRTGEGSR